MLDYYYFQMLPQGWCYVIDNSTQPIQRPNVLRFFLWSAICYIVFLLTYTTYISYEAERSAVQDIDAKLLAAANQLPSLLAEDFHDRAIEPESITKEEELVNRQRVNDFVKGGGFAYAYTLVEWNGELYFSAPTVTEEEAAERESWYFYPYEQAPEEFRKALYTGQTQFFSYQDNWGLFRSVAVPMVSPQGRKYLSCVDVKQDFVNNAMSKAHWISLITALLFSLVLLLFTFTGFMAHKAVLNYSAAMLLRNAKLRQEANYDALTGLLNSRSFFRMAEKLYMKTVSSKQGGAVLMIDCDNFKEINDHYGHLAGDRALAFLADIYRQYFPDRALIGRYGGDEFIIFIPGFEGAEEAARSVIEAVQGSTLSDNGANLALSVSIGMVCFHDDARTFHELVKMADDALLAVKQSNKSSLLNVRLLN